MLGVYGIAFKEFSRAAQPALMIGQEGLYMP
jgi:hypothetical protein